MVVGWEGEGITKQETGDRTYHDSEDMFLRGEKRLEVEDEIRKQVDAIMREELDLLKMVVTVIIITNLLFITILIIIMHIAHPSISSPRVPSC